MIRTVTYEDKEFWLSIDKHSTECLFERKVRDKLGYVVEFDGKPVGVMHYNLLWDNMPFLNFLYFRSEHRRKGLGKEAMLYWEAEMKQNGFPMTMVSTQADEGAQHFYRKLGYKDSGCLVLNDCPMQQPLEIFMTKIL